MGSHYDDDATIPPKFMRQLFEQEQQESIEKRMANLTERMKEATAAGKNLITAGRDGETLLFRQTASGMHVQRLPDDPDGVVRISIGVPEWDAMQAYLAFRGDPARVFDLLQRSVKVMRSMLPEIQREARSSEGGEEG